MTSQPQLRQPSITSFREELLRKIKENGDITETITQILSCDGNLSQRYSLLPMSNLIQNNSQSLDQIKRFGLALNILEKYCRHLLKPQEIRSQMWRYVKFTNEFFRERIDIIKGGRDVMKLMGYTKDIKDGLAFPSTAVTDDKTLTILLADILIGKRELDAFITNEHPNTKSINILLPASTFLQLKKMHSPISRPESSQTSSTDNTSRPQEPPHQQYPPIPEAGGHKPVQQQSSVGNGDTEETVVKMSKYNPAAYGYVENSPVNYVAPTIAGQQLPTQNFIEAPTVLVQDQPITAQIPSSAVQSAQGLTNQVIPDTNQTKQSDKLSSEKLESIVCDICGDSTAEFVCDKCDNKQLCSTCDERWHQHPKRISHERQNIHRLPSNSNRSSNENNSVYFTPNEHMPPAQSTLHPQQYVPPPPAAHLPPHGHEYVNTMPIAHPQSEEARMNKLEEQVPYVPEMYSNANNSKASEQVPYVQQMPEIYGKGAINKTGEHLPYVQQVPGAISKVPSSMAVGHPASGQMNTSTQNPTLPAWPQQLSPKQGQIVQIMPQSSSPHIMPQGGVPSFSMMHSFTPSPQAGSMTPPLNKVLQNYPSSSAPGGPPTSKLLAKIMAVPDLNKRRSKVDIDLAFLEEEMEHVDKKIETISIQNPKFYEDEEYATLYRKKGMLQRERMQLEKYGQELDGILEENIKSQQHGGQGHGDILHRQIFYPPSYVPMTYTPGVPTPTLSIPLGRQQQPLNQGTISKQGMAYYLIPSFPNQAIGHPSHQVLVHSPPGTSDLQGQGYLGSIPMPSNHSNYLPAEIQGQDQSQHMNQNPVYQRYLHQNSVQGLSVQCTSPGMSVCSPGVAPKSPKQIPLNIPPETHVEPKISNLQSNPMTIGKAISQDHSNKAAQLTQKHQTPGNRNSSKFQDYPPSAQTIFENYPQPPDVTEPPKVPQPIMPSDHTGDTIKKKSEGYGTAWICQHCTFHNSPNTRVCEVCFKTSISPRFLSDEGTTTSGSKKPPQVAAAAVFRAETEVREAEHDTTRSEETEVLAMASNAAKRIQQNYDQIYYEKKEAHRKFQEQLEREKSAQNQNVNAQPGQALTVESSDQSQFAASKPLLSSPVTSHLEPSAISESAKNVESSSFAIEPKSSEATGNLKKSKTPTGSPSSKPTLNFTETMEKINQKRQQDIMMIEGREVVKLLKTAEEDGFTAEEAEIALEKCIQDNLTPIAWLKEKWQPMLDTVVTMTTIAGTNMDMNEVGELSIVEARKALKEWGGDVEAAVKQCVETRQKMYKEISLIDNYPREEILSAMLHGQGDISIALDDLNTNRLQQFLDRLWLYDETPQSPEREVETHDVCNSVTNSVLRHTDFQALIRDTTVDKERRIRMIMVEGKLQSWGRASTVIRILDHDVASNGLEASLEEIVEAVKNCGDRQSSLVYLQQECQVCFSLYPMSKIRSLNCPCKICADCMKSYFEITIREKHVRNLSCPNCQQPDMENTEAASEYLAFLTMMLGAMVSTEILELYETKLRDWHLQRDPNFRWCTHCGGGFIYQYGHRQLAMQCPHCHLKTCFKCKKQWEDQHEGLTCEEYEQWKIDNDPENQTIGLAAHLEANGIDCPSCKMRYSLAKGGCMHFKCPECGHEFCSGCSQQFFVQGTCNRFKSCRTKGLHCHHPRDCFYYLRDYDTDQLQNLLTDKGINFDTDTPANQMDPNHCPVMEQKEVMDKKNDEPCGREVAEGQAGLCLNHYKEYLVGLINRNKVDPIDVMNSDEITRLIERQEKTAPKIKPNYQAQQYRKKLIQFVKEKIPLLR